MILPDHPLHIDVKDANILVRQANKLEFEVTGNDFDVTVTGFDSDRDLLIKADYDD